MPLAFLTVALMMQNLHFENVQELKPADFTQANQCKKKFGWFSSCPQQAHLLLPRQPADGCEARTVQSPLLDLEQLVGGVQYSETFFFSSSFLLFTQRL